MPDLPPMGGEAGPISCGRLLRFPDPASRCPADATWHIIWTQVCENGIVCDEHKTEAVTQWRPYAVHRYEMACSMPGAVFVYNENRCRVDEDLLGITEAEMATVDA